MPFRAILFDLDGSLVDTNATHVEAWGGAFADHGYSIPAERIRPEIGKGGDQLVPAVLGEVPDDAQKSLETAHGDHFVRLTGERRFPLMPGASELVAECRRRKLRTVLCTSSGKKHLDAIAKSCGTDFRDAVDVLVSADDADRSKPAPDLVQASAEKVGLPPGDCVLIGDTPHDGTAARKAGAHFWAVLCGGTASREQLESAGAEWVVLDPAQLLEQLDEALAPPEAAAMG